MSEPGINKYLVSIVGPTAVGKTALSLRLAGMFRCPVISADSRQLFREMDIGTAKVSKEEQEQVQHYFIDQISPSESLSAGKFGEQVEEILTKEFQERFLMLICGGSGFYLQSVWEGLDDIPAAPPEIREALNQTIEQKGLEVLVKELEQVDPETYSLIDRQNPARVVRALEVFRTEGKPISHYRKQRKQVDKPYQIIKIGLTMDRPELYARIEKRVDLMLEQGLLEEVRTLLEKYGPDAPGLQSVGYREFIPYFKGEYDLDRAIELVKRNSRRLAKRQYTWFRRYDDIAWFEYNEFREVEEYLLNRIGVA